jgi:hypothetical protein
LINGAHTYRSIDGSDKHRAPQRRRRWRVQIGWHGAILAALLIGVGVFLAGRLDVSEVTPQRAGAVLIPIAVAYYLLWRYAVSFLNSLVGLDVLRDDVAERIP